MAWLGNKPSLYDAQVSSEAESTMQDDEMIVRLRGRARFARGWGERDIDLEPAEAEHLGMELIRAAGRARAGVVDE